MEARRTRRGRHANAQPSRSPPSRWAACSSTWPSWRTTRSAGSGWARRWGRRGTPRTGTPTRTGEWHSAADSPEQLLTLWQDAVARSRSVVEEALAKGGPGQLGRITTSAGESPSLRRLLIDLIEEYARHVGHADSIRESVDGLVGEDPLD
ncbi:DUF664 domain-containing protein [Streptomyces sp. NPDC051320]|uniref:mycothiol transferase n=1 Tax=Streptomyces sp. NPDC051320 TaxID=3154644 RepID=UPI0034231FB9